MVFRKTNLDVVVFEMPCGGGSSENTPSHSSSTPSAGAWWMPTKSNENLVKQVMQYQKPDVHGDLVGLDDFGLWIGN